MHYTAMFGLLQGKLQTAATQVEDLIGLKKRASELNRAEAKGSETRRLKYAVFAKTSLKAVFDDLEKWRSAFDPSFFLVARISVPVIDQQITEKRADQSKVITAVSGLRQAHQANERSTNTTASVFIPSQKIPNRELIKYSTASVANDSTRRIIIEHIPVTFGLDVEVATKDARDLARVLSKVDPEQFGLLSCRGVMKVLDEGTSKTTGFDFIFSYPVQGMGPSPCSLRRLLLEWTTNFPLNERVRLAVSLARAIVFLHSSRVVHKSIRPENIIVLQETPGKIGAPFLVGFEKFRFVSTVSAKSGDSLWEKNLYRHPRRQGPCPEEGFKMEHDIYSIGVCLLEIGLWSSFVDYSSTYQIGNESIWTPGRDLPITEHILSSDRRGASEKIKNHLLGLARQRLPASMGAIYTNIVISCLTCLDQGNEGFGDIKEFEDEDGIVVGVRYIEKVILRRSLSGK